MSVSPRLPLLTSVLFLCSGAVALAGPVAPLPAPTASATPTANIPGTPGIANPASSSASTSSTHGSGHAAPGSLGGGFSYSGVFRAYNFVRQNAQQNAGNPNRQAFAPGGTFHLEYKSPTTPLRVATSYSGAYTDDFNGPNPAANTKIDNTLPGFSLSTFSEAYVAYTDKVADFTIGDRIFNFAWMPSSDTRIKPASYQGGDINFKPVKNLNVGVSRILRFQSRTNSNFDAATLLTEPVAGQPAPVVVHNNPGALHVYAVYGNDLVSARLEHYAFYDLANLEYADAKVLLSKTSKAKPFVSAQYVAEHNTGRSYLGRVANNTIGFQVGANATKQLAFTFGLDSAPTHYALVNAASAAASQTGIFLPAGGTGTNARVGGATFRTAYGGIASPYSDGYATDPLFTTSISQGMADRRSAGTSFKVAGTYISPNRKLKIIGSEAYYQYDNLLLQNRTFEDDADVTYFFMNVPAKGAYKGLSIRQRYANRSQPTIPYDFKYIRTQLQYDF